MEIEKKYLVEKLPENLDSYNKTKISQAYISTYPTIRIRKFDNIYFLTIKSKGHLSREEFELEITKDEFDNLLSKTEGNIITKTRYYIPLDNGLTAELDIFHDNLEKLITVEVEFKSIIEAENFVKPEWFGKDVTYESNYKNSSLSKLNTINEIHL